MYFVKREMKKDLSVLARHQCLMPVIPATQEVEIRRIGV
jgi:hypothetical protein